MKEVESIVRVKYFVFLECLDSCNNLFSLSVTFSIEVKCYKNVPNKLIIIGLS